MKKIGFILFCWFMVSAEATEVHLPVSGMVCGFCAQGITKKLKAHSEVSQVDVNLAQQSVVITLKKGQNLSDQTITELIRDAGFTPGDIERK